MITQCPDCDLPMKKETCSCGYSVKASAGRYPVWQPPKEESLLPKDEALKRIADLREKIPSLRKYG